MGFDKGESQLHFLNSSVLTTPIFSAFKSKTLVNGIWKMLLQR